MNSSAIHNSLSGGVPPFELCRIVSKRIRAQHKRGDHIQDLMGAAFKSLSQAPLAPTPYPIPKTANFAPNHTSETAPN